MLLRLAGLAALALVALTPSPRASAATLYDAGLNTPPASQAWGTLAIFPVTTSIGGGTYTVDTTFSNLLLAGSTRLSPLALNAATGYELTVSLRVASESHESPNRAGFSLIAIGQDPTKSIELGFWTDRVFAYTYNAADPDRFVPGPSYTVDTTGQLRTYRLRVANNLYSVFVDDVLAFGNLALYDYTPFNGLIDPYETANLLFFGDDTTRASSRVAVASLSIAPVPLPASLPLIGAALATLAGLARRRG